MANEIKVGKNETIDSALRRFKRMSQKAGTLAEVRKREHYEKPSVRRKKKSEAARKRKAAEYRREWYLLHREREIARAARWRQKDRER